MKYIYYGHKGYLASLRERKSKRKKLIRNALRGAAGPITLEDIRIFQIEGSINLESLKENIGSIFPLVLNLVADGHSISSIEKMLGMKDRLLENLLMRYRPLGEAVIMARKVANDDSALRDMMR